MSEQYYNNENRNGEYHFTGEQLNRDTAGTAGGGTPHSGIREGESRHRCHKDRVWFGRAPGNDKRRL